MTSMTTRPAHVPAPIAKVDGDSVIMSQDYQQRRANEISALGGGFPYVLAYRLDHHLDIHHDSAFCFRTFAALIKELQNRMAMDGTHSFAAALAGVRIDITEYTDPTPTPTDTAPVTGQPAPTFDELRAATNAASAAELAAHNALVKAENAYASAAEVDPNDRHGWNRATGRFARTKAGQQLHAALTEARKVLREAVRVDTEACRKTWVNGFGALNTPAPVDTDDLTYQPVPAEYYGVDDSGSAAIVEGKPVSPLDPVRRDDFQEGYRDASQGLPVQPNRFGLYRMGYEAGRIDKDALDNAPDLTATPDERPDIITRLADVGHAMNSTRPTQTEYQVLAALIDSADAMISLRAQLAEANNIIGGLNADLRTCEKSRKATEEAWAGNDEAARAEIEQLRGQLDAVIGGEPVIKIWHDAEYDPRPWRYAIRECSRVAQFDCKTEAEAQEKTQTHLENWRKEQARARR